MESYSIQNQISENKTQSKKESQAKLKLCQ